MDARRFVAATVVGAIALSVAGYAVFALLFPGFYADFMRAGSATGVERQPMLWWPIAVGMLSYSALLTIVIGSNGRPASVREGLKIGAIVSALLWITADFLLYGMSNVGNLTGIIVDPLLELVAGAIGGGVIGLVLGRMAKAGPAGASRDARAHRAA